MLSESTVDTHVSLLIDRSAGVSDFRGAVHNIRICTVVVHGLTFPGPGNSVG